MPDNSENNPSNAERTIRLLKYPGLSIDACIRGSRVVGVNARGMFKGLMRSTIELMEEYVVREKPAVLGDDFVIDVSGIGSIFGLTTPHPSRWCTVSIP